MKLIIIILLIISVAVSAQEKKVFIDASTNKAIEFVNVVATQLRSGVISSQNGEVFWNIYTLANDDTILITHVSYIPVFLSFKTFQLKDTIILEPKFALLSDVVVKQDIDISLYRREITLGYYQNKYDGGFYMRPGQQLGVKIENPINVKGFISKVNLHFEKIVPNATFRVRLKKYDQNGTIGDDLLPNGILIKPTRQKTSVNLIDFKIPIYKYGIFVAIDYLGDGNFYEKWMDAPYNILRNTHKYVQYNTYSNFMDAYKWNKLSSLIRNENNPSNAQIQVEILYK